MDLTAERLGLTGGTALAEYLECYHQQHIPDGPAQAAQPQVTRLGTSASIGLQPDDAG